MSTSEIIPNGTKVRDRDGFEGVVLSFDSRFGGYEIRFDRGHAIRFPSDLTVVRS